MKDTIKFWIGLTIFCPAIITIVGVAYGTPPGVLFLFAAQGSLYIAVVAVLVHGIDVIEILVSDHEEVQLLRQQVNELMGINNKETP